MRIISGIYKGKNLKGFHIEGTRPTMDRIKESLFALLQTELKNKQVLDLYAGSGSLGLEALSNGALTCTFVDKNKIAIQTIKENVRGIKGAVVIESDAFQLHQHIKEPFDLIFLDPPYHEHLIGSTLNYLKEHHYLKKGTLIVCEYEDEIFEIDGFQLWKEKKYGKKYIKIIKF